MRGLPWGELYDKYHKNPYDKQKINQRVTELLSDPYVNKPANIFEFILGGETQPQLLDIRIFDDSTKRARYYEQTMSAKKKGTSNCPLCTVGHSANANKIWKITEVEHINEHLLMLHCCSGNLNILLCRIPVFPAKSHL